MQEIITVTFTTCQTQ